MITKKFGIDFTSNSGGALTLYPEYVLNDDSVNLQDIDWENPQVRTHENGWVVKGEIHENYYEWVNEFEAIHPKFGRVWGDFENEVYADSEEGFENFYKEFPPHEWDYADI